MMGLPDPAATTGQMRERRRSDYPVLRTTPLRWADVDTYGHVNNAVHYLLMDTAINGWLGEAVGVDIRSELSGFAVVAETGCRYLREIHFPATPELGIRLEGTGRSSVRYEVGFFTDDEGPVALARFVHVYVDHVTRRPTGIPAEVRRALGALRETS
ncbi:acyl-CoA thioesterase [Actinomadura madurae]|uniref:acyl-CoA thioesterase n=2 Tax=Actinomadura madurae TaxID=1993 RepID=UPI0027E391C2|nr:thioesterase family protein [Actinomadura madurae]